MTRLWATVLLLAAVVFPREAGAHGFRPGSLTLIERAPGTFEMGFTPPVDTTRKAADIDIAFPDGCRERGQRLICGDAGLAGDIALSGLPDGMRVVVTVTWLDGQHAEWIVHAGAPRVSVAATPTSSAVAWLRIGAEHILFGLDHLAFVLALLLVLGARLDRRLLSTLTAFTVAHSLTLALAVLDVVKLPSGPVEAAIAASVVLVAREATHDQPTATRKWPWAVALLFGLVHGLGFAGALSDLGLPEGAVGWALLWFNVGVELGQIAIVAVAIALVRAAKTWLAALPGAKLAGCYAIGGLAAWWLIDRAAPIITARW